jgi:hypothetical protein
MAEPKFTTADIRHFFECCERAGPDACVDPGADLVEFMANYPWSERYMVLYTRTQQACADLGHRFGFNPWLLSSIDSLTAKPRLLVMGLNPAGSRDYPDHRGRFRYELAAGYFTQWDKPDWSPLQRQVHMLLGELQRRVGDVSELGKFARKRVVMGSLVPFRSPSEAELHRREESLAFGRRLWRDVFEDWWPQAAVTFGNTPFKELSLLLGRATSEQRFPSGWGNINLTLREFDSGSRLLGLPHLSRFAVFGRPEGEAGIAAAFDALMSGICATPSAAISA